MATFEAGDIVVVPFPFTDRSTTKRRPALVLSRADPFGARTKQLICAMITSAKQSSWPLDTPISNIDEAGLTAQSIVRTKLFTLDNRLIIRRAGVLATVDWKQVRSALRELLDL